MTIIIETNTSSSDEWKQVPPGLHLARCYRIIELGTQTTVYDGIEKKLPKISIFWELHGQDDAGENLVTSKGEPMAIFKNYTAMLSDKSNLKIDLQNWRSKPFTREEQNKFVITDILNQWCMLTVIHNPSKKTGKIYSNVSNISPVPAIYKQQGLPKGFNPCTEFSVKNPDYELFETFGKGLKSMIEASPEWQALQARQDSPRLDKTRQGAAGSGFDDMEDDLPF